MNFEDISNIVYLMVYIGVFFLEIYFLKTFGKVLIDKIKDNRPFSEMQKEVGIIFSLIGVIFLFTGTLKYEYYRIPAAFFAFMNPYLLFVRKNMKRPPSGF